MNKEPTKLRDLIQADDEERVIEIDESGVVVKDTLSVPDGVSSVNVHELKTKLAIADRLSELEHEAAEAAIAVRIYQTTTLPFDANHQEWWAEYQRIFRIRTEAEDVLIKFKEESNHGHST